MKIRSLVRSENLDTINILKEELGAEFFYFYKARLFASTGQYQEAEKMFRELVGSPSMSTEALSELIGIGMVSKPFRYNNDHYELLLASLLPASGYSERQNSRSTPRFADIRGTPVIPSPRSRLLHNVAKQMFDMCMFSSSANAYVEAIDTTFYPVRSTDAYGQAESWLSPVSAPLWLKAAQAEWQTGHADVAANYIAKAIVFGSDATKDEALKVLEEWREQGVPATPATPEPDASKLKQIAQQYAQMNMHPRAIELMKQFAPVIGPDAATLQAQYEKEWLALVARYCVGTVDGKCVLFGQNVSQPEDRLNVQIPPPLRPEALAEVAQTVRELVAKDNAGK